MRKKSHNFAKNLKEIEKMDQYLTHLIKNNNQDSTSTEFWNTF